MDFDNSEKIVITITKMKFRDEFMHWEVDVESNYTNTMGGTAPTIWGVLDMATDHIWESGQEDEWFKDDANARN